MNYAVIKKFDIANGPGVRVSLFVSGCRHRCKNCFNSEAWDFSYGKPFTNDTLDEILTALSPNHIEGFSHLWLIWHFSAFKRSEVFRPTVRPPRLGGNRTEGVFATRSPNRPNPVGLSSVRLVGVEHNEKDGTYLIVEGADLLDGTPIFDIKPYLPASDLHPDATGGFADAFTDYRLSVECEESLLALLPEEKREALLAVLADDPRPAYQNDPTRIYGFSFAGFEIKFSVDGETLTVRDIFPN